MRSGVGFGLLWESDLSCFQNLVFPENSNYPQETALASAVSCVPAQYKTCPSLNPQSGSDHRELGGTLWWDWSETAL
jgi:hypothetical protein